MAKVPVYESAQVTPNPLGAPRTDAPMPRDVATSADFFGGVEARQDAALGAALTRSGTDFSLIAIDMQKRENEDKVQRSEVALKEEYLKQEQDWHANRQGRFAVELTNDASNWWDTAVVRHGESLDNPVQQQMFAKRMGELRGSSIKALSTFQAVQLEKSHDESWVANKVASINIAAANPTDENISVARQELLDGNIAQGARRGWTAEVLAAHNLKDTTNLHKNVIQGLVQSDPAGAAAYFEANKKEIDGAQHAEIGKFAKDASATAIGDMAAAAVWEKHGPKADNDPVNLDKMEDAVREAITEPTARKAAIASLRDRTSAFDKGTKERAAGYASAVAQAAMGDGTPGSGAPLSEIMKMPEWLNMSGTEQKRFADAFEDRRDTKKRRAQADVEHAANVADRADRRADLAVERADRQQQRDNDGAYLTYSDPTVLTGMSRKEVQALWPDLGTAHTKTLVDRWDALQASEGKLHEAKIDNDSFNNIARDMNLNPDFIDLKGDKLKEAKGRLGAAKNAVEQAIDQEQRARPGKPPLNREEKDQIARRVLSQTVIRDPGFFARNVDMPAAAVTEADLKRIVVPKADAVTIKARLTKDGKPAKAEDIARAYLIWQRSEAQ